MHAYAIIFSVFFIHCVLLLFRQLLSVFHGATHSQLSELGKEGRRWHLVTAAREGTHSQRPERVLIHSGQRGYSFTAAREGTHSQWPEKVFIHSGQRGYSFTVATEGIH